MMLEVVKAVVGLMVLMALWIAVQAYLRRRLALGAGADVLEDMTHGCGNCGHAGACGSGRSSCGQGEPNHESH